MANRPHVEHPKHRQQRTPRRPTQPAHKVDKKPATRETKREKPTPLPADHVGVDRLDFPFLVKKRDEPRVDKDRKWMQTLYTVSNLRMVGAYVCGPPLSGSPRNQFTVSALDVDRAWLPNLAALVEQGWGIVFWYLGYSLGQRGRKLKPGEKHERARGKLHGRHLRACLAVLGAEWAGATVMIDQEDDKGTKFPKNLLDYYRGLFDEMARPDPELPSFRPGMYCRIDDVRPLLQTHPDLFLWEVKYDTSTNKTTEHPFEAKEPQTKIAFRKLIVFPEKRPISPTVVERGKNPSSVIWPLGRQFRYYTGPLPPPESPVPTQNPPWLATKDTRHWDFDTALVRNPAFPIAEPRLTAAVHAGGVVLLRGTFRPPVAGAGSAAHPALMEIEQMTLPSPTALSRAQNHAPAPEAPMVLLHRPHELLAVTVLRESRLGLATRSDQTTPKRWSALDVMSGNKTDVRRLYALAGTTVAPDDVLAFFIGTDQRLYACRSSKGAAWTEDVVLDDERLHPFSQLAAVARGSQTVAVFFLDEAGSLGLAFWPTAKAWPSFTRLALESKTAHSLLPGTALAAVSPSDDEIFAFGIGRDLRLWFVAYSTATKSWTVPAAIGATKDFVAPHARIAAHAPSVDRIEVLTITDDAKAVIYPFTRSGGSLSASAREVLADPPAAATAPGSPPATSQSGRTPARGWRLNPFGDVAILQGSQGSTVAYAAGLKGGQHQILRRETTASGSWEVFTA